MTLINSPIFWKGIAVGFCFGFFVACLAISALALLLLDAQEKQDSRQSAVDSARKGTC